MQSKFLSLINEQKNMGLLMLWMAIIPIASSLTATYIFISLEEEILAFNGWQWGLFYVLSMLTMTFAVTPTTYVAIVSGYFLGWESLPMVVVSYQLASLLGYFFAGRLSEGFISGIENYYPKSRRYFYNVERKQWSTTFLSRISPALPFALMNVVLSVSRIRLAPFFWAGLIGMLPRTVFFIWVGSQAQYFSEAIQNKEGQFWMIALSVLGIYLLYRLIKPRG
ncbi:TVP38/TMEM64 family protein [Reichenbachiella ulvae]|uniref:TVP38/TMEM64 family membrane protein n=1 Tax=Reichenbachiella ulvae TaxID=2980104 RepID=A0ABT3CWP4_9BACT|nr:VTT domain-containing protein [Reichenbachiella ulvae]MCV9387991.1 VTT domain-containing protein [Reichenbachiella ulvae]